MIHVPATFLRIYRISQLVAMVLPHCGANDNYMRQL